ncbi:MAG: bifunctional 5,10-methylene-tetrahydrofolate dehydrogenase/5,10-methylene-tetrahydrofolate cyclohydrolase [Treponema sp.]|nr:bifunctional 5,10-methylene-tetrahydrofolate dehydrogenase/5,10-methylene-tetrahydrofolate cyclohydrolase [Treponema sp.]
MSAIILDGKVTGKKLRENAKERTTLLRKQGHTPCLAVILVGDNPASHSYVKAKEKALAEAGMEGRSLRLGGETSEAELLGVIKSLNADDSVHGILVQLPLPRHIREAVVINAVDPRKDVDCFHRVNVGKLLLEEPGFLPCTPHGVIQLLREHKIPTKGAHAVVIGRSNIVGKPLAMLLARKEFNATVTMCHTGTKNLAFHTRQADILIAAVGQPGLITGDMVKRGAAVIDVGVNRVSVAGETGYRLTGDVVFEEAAQIAGWITPVPGGVGPMTIAMLMLNSLSAAEIRYGGKCGT